MSTEAKTPLTPEEKAEKRAARNRPVPVEFVVVEMLGHRRRFIGSAKVGDLAADRPPGRIVLTLERVEFLDIGEGK